MVRMNMSHQYGGDILRLEVQLFYFLKNATRAVDEQQLISLINEKRSIIPYFRCGSSASP